MTREPRRIVIIGGGFAGAGLARELGRRMPPGWEVFLFSQENNSSIDPSR